MDEKLEYSDKEIIGRIVKLTEGVGYFWLNSSGWASFESANLMSKSRLDWQASLARMLRIYLDPDVQKEEGLILAWSTLGSLTEGVLKLFLSVWYTEYKGSAMLSTIKKIKDKKGVIIEPDILMLETLRIFFEKEVYSPAIRKSWKEQGKLDIIDWVLNP